MTPKEAAEALGIHYTTVLHHINKTGLLKATKTPAGWDIDPESVAAFSRPARQPGRRGGTGSTGRIARGGTTPAERGQRNLYLGTKITPAEIARIRKSIIPADLRGRIMLRLADLAEAAPENYKRALEIIGVKI